MSEIDPPRLLDHDGDLVVAYKPSGWVVHSTGAEGEQCLDLWLDETLSISGHSPVHRLDKPVSGLILYSADPELRAQMSELFASRETEKRYTALVHGRTRRKGVLRRPLKDPRRKKQLEAVTRYRLMRWLGAFSLLEVRPETGRKHQIRRHLQGMGHGIVGDTRYRHRGKKPPADGGRIWLHAAGLVLPDGRQWEADLSPDLRMGLDALVDAQGKDV